MDIILGDYAVMKILRNTQFGAYLDAGMRETYSEILLPTKEVPPHLAPGDHVRVFIYKDSQNRPVATTRKPKIRLGRWAPLEVMDVNQYGAFLDWGIENQLLMPYKEQPHRYEKGDIAVVMLYHDMVSDRLAATGRVEKNLSKTIDEADKSILTPGLTVKILIYGRTERGWRAIIDHETLGQKYVGILFDSDVYNKVSVGSVLSVFIKGIREDGKIDLTLRKTGLDELEDCKEKILNALRQNRGYLRLSDDSTPEEIKKVLFMSKKSFKRSAGMLLKEGKVEFSDDGIYSGIRLVQSGTALKK